MATSNPSEHYPAAKFFFRVSFGNILVSFQEVSGLEQQVEQLEYRHGKSRQLTKQVRAGLARTTNITLKRGVFQDRSELVELFGSVLDERHYHPQSGHKLDFLVSLMDYDGSSAVPVMTWKVRNAMPVKFSGPDLRADANEVAVESIEFAHEGVSVEM
ncbi:MAG: hypothetical protein OHK0039_16200 [Bacteroidia bacterium]